MHLVGAAKVSNGVHYDRNALTERGSKTSPRLSQTPAALAVHRLLLLLVVRSGARSRGTPMRERRRRPSKRAVPRFPPPFVVAPFSFWSDALWARAAYHDVSSRLGRFPVAESNRRHCAADGFKSGLDCQSRFVETWQGEYSTLNDNGNQVGRAEEHEVQAGSQPRKLDPAQTDEHPQGGIESG